MDYSKITEQALSALREWQLAHPHPDSPGGEHDLADYVAQGITAALKEYDKQK